MGFVWVASDHAVDGCKRPGQEIHPWEFTLSSQACSGLFRLWAIAIMYTKIKYDVLMLWTRTRELLDKAPVRDLLIIGFLASQPVK